MALNETDAALVSEAVHAAEQHTSGEILTVLAQRSDGYSDVVLVWAITLSFTAMSLFALMPKPFLDFWDRLTGSWGHVWSAGQLASLTIAIGLLTFLLIWLLLSQPRLRFLAVPGPVRSARVRNAAVRHFKVGAERRTHGRTGVLLYLSMDEHRAEIVADASIAEKVPAEVWGEAMADLLTEVRQGRLAHGLAAGVRDVGAVLAEHFPRADDDVNELPDRLILL